jgi:hypothetical protein
MVSNREICYVFDAILMPIEAFISKIHLLHGQDSIVNFAPINHGNFMSIFILLIFQVFPDPQPPL